MSGTAIIVNEFGAVGLDDAIFAQTASKEDIKLLANGCMCCVADDDLAVTLLELTRRTDRVPSRIVVETTGLADPANLLHKIMVDPRIRPYVRLDGVITTVDAVNGMKTLSGEPVAQRQAAMADLRVITKTDLVDSSAVLVLETQLRGLNAGADILRINHGDISCDRLFGMSLIDSNTGNANLEKWLNSDAHRVNNSTNDHHIHPDHVEDSMQVHYSGSHLRENKNNHGAGVGTWLIEEARPVDWEGLSPRIGAIIEKYGDFLLRLKGVVWTNTDPRPLVIHGVQKIFHAPTWLEKWPVDPGTALVAIGSEGIQPAIEMLTSALQECAIDIDHPANRGSGMPRMPRPVTANRLPAKN